MILDKEITEELFYDFSVWMWKCDLNVTRDDIEDFFRENGITRHEAVTSANHHGIVISVVTFENDRSSGWARFWKWIWK